MNLFDSGNEAGAEANTSRTVGNAFDPGVGNSQEANNNNNNCRMPE